MSSENWNVNVSSSEDEIPEKTKRLLLWKAQRAAATPRKSASKLAQYREIAHLDYRSPTVKKYEEYVHQLEEEAKLSAEKGKENSTLAAAQKHSKPPLPSRYVMSKASPLGISLTRSSKLVSAPASVPAPPRWEQSLSGSVSVRSQSSDVCAYDKSPLKSFRFGSAEDIDVVDAVLLDTKPPSVTSTAPKCGLDDAVSEEDGRNRKEGGDMTSSVCAGRTMLREAAPSMCETEEHLFTESEESRKNRESRLGSINEVGEAVQVKSISADSHPASNHEIVIQISILAPEQRISLLPLALEETEDEVTSADLASMPADTEPEEMTTRIHGSHVAAEGAELTVTVTEDRDSVDISDLESDQMVSFSGGFSHQRPPTRDSTEASIPGEQVRAAMSRYYDSTAEADADEEELESGNEGGSDADMNENRAGDQLEYHNMSSDIIMTDSIITERELLWKNIAPPKPLIPAAAGARTLEFSPELDKMGNPIPSPPVSEDVSVRRAERLLRESTIASELEESVFDQELGGGCLWRNRSIMLFGVILLTILYTVPPLLLSIVQVEIDGGLQMFELPHQFGSLPVEVLHVSDTKLYHNTNICEEISTEYLHEKVGAIDSSTDENAPNEEILPHSEVGNLDFVNSVTSFAPRALLITSYTVQKEGSHQSKMIQVLDETCDNGVRCLHNLQQDSAASASIVTESPFISFAEDGQQMQRSEEPVTMQPQEIALELEPESNRLDQNKKLHTNTEVATASVVDLSFEALQLQQNSMTSSGDGAESIASVTTIIAEESNPNFGYEMKHSLVSPDGAEVESQETRQIVDEVQHFPQSISPPLHSSPQATAKDELTHQLQGALKLQESKLSRGFSTGSVQPSLMLPYFDFQEPNVRPRPKSAQPEDTNNLYYYSVVFSALSILSITFACLSSPRELTAQHGLRAQPPMQSQLQRRNAASFSRASSLLREEEHRILNESASTPASQTRTSSKAAPQTGRKSPSEPTPRRSSRLNRY